MLTLYGADNRANRALSDAICSALQLINFLQDVSVDRAKGRIYLPLVDLARFNVTPIALDAGVTDANWHALMDFQIQRARAMMHYGAPLALVLPGRVGWELRCVVQGGLRILERIEQVEHDIFKHRPQLGWPDWLCIAWRALRM